MKKTILTALFAFAILIINGQTDMRYGKKVSKEKPGFYKTYDDLLNDKIEYLGEFHAGYNIDTYVVLEEKGSKPIELKGGVYFGLKDQYGNRYRIVNGHAMNMVCAGKICFYTRGYEMGEWWIKSPKNKKGGAGANVGYGNTYIYYSKGPETGLMEMKKWLDKETVANTFFKDDETIKKEYLNDDSDDYDPDCKRCHSDEIERIIFYVTKYNEAHK